MDRAGQRAVAADNDQAIDLAASEDLSRTVADLALVKFLAARGSEDRAAFAEDAGDVARAERDERVVE